MKTKAILVLGISTAMICIALTAIFYSYFVVVEATSIHMDLKVGDHIGLNTDVDAMHFGIVASPGYGNREFIVTNNNSIPVEVTIRLHGEMIKWINVSDYNFYLEPGEHKTVELEAYIPRGTEHGYYEGKIQVILKRI
ncbi:MAG: hypothetical protein MAG795_00043 [Candidatus Woesearchaeota archaeon]|nr:hypothetical protein [Candidatus Woesearchaeota archaeon]